MVGLNVITYSDLCLSCEAVEEAQETMIDGKIFLRRQNKCETTMDSRHVQLL